ncbi:hypothetical protein H8959_022773 [Pygathrix nigripes]
MAPAPCLLYWTGCTLAGDAPIRMLSLLRIGRVHVWLRALRCGLANAADERSPRKRNTRLGHPNDVTGELKNHPQEGKLMST